MRGIIRNRLKVASAVGNAKASLLKVQDEFGSFDSYIWAFVWRSSRSSTA